MSFAPSSLGVSTRHDERKERQVSLGRNIKVLDVLTDAYGKIERISGLSSQTNNLEMILRSRGRQLQRSTLRSSGNIQVVHCRVKNAEIKNEVAFERIGSEPLLHSCYSSPMVFHYWTSTTVRNNNKQQFQGL